MSAKNVVTHPKHLIHGSKPSRLQLQPLFLENRERYTASMMLLGNTLLSEELSEKLSNHGNRIWPATVYDVITTATQKYKMCASKTCHPLSSEGTVQQASPKHG